MTPPVRRETSTESSRTDVYSYVGRRRKTEGSASIAATSRGCYLILHVRHFSTPTIPTVIRMAAPQPTVVFGSRDLTFECAVGRTKTLVVASSSSHTLQQVISRN